MIQIIVIIKKISFVKDYLPIYLLKYQYLTDRFNLIKARITPAPDKRK